jgi:DNA-binding NarL/FixJ family response regulator
MLPDTREIRILIADDHKLFNQGLSTLLSFTGSPYKVIWQVYNGNEVIPAIHKLQPDIVLLDINLPQRNGLDIAGQLVAEFPKVKIVIISMYNNRKFVDDARKIGVSGYLLKSASQQQLLACLESVVSGKQFIDDNLNERLTVSAEKDGFVKRFKLSPREIEIILLMKDGHDSSEISERLFLSKETVKTHRKNIYYTLNINNLASLIRFANEQGL